MSFLGLAVNLCSTASVSHALKVLGSVSSGSKFMDKVVIPIGTFCVSCYVGDKVGEHVDKQISNAKENFETIKELRKMTKAYDAQFGNGENNADKIFHNVFEDQDVENDEEVTDNGNS